MSELHVGIDNGQTGSLVALSTVAGLEPVSILHAPFRKVDGVPQMDIRRIVDWILEIYPRDGGHIWLEKCPKHAMSQASMRSQAINYGKYIALFESRFPHLHLHRVKCGRELQGWQRALLGAFTSENSKEVALAKAKEIWPKMEWPADKRGMPYNGVIDAALIGEWGRRQIQDR